MEHVSAFPIYRRIQLDKLIGLKCGAVAPIATLKHRPCVCPLLLTPVNKTDHEIQHVLL